MYELVVLTGEVLHCSTIMNYLNRVNCTVIGSLEFFLKLEIHSVERGICPITMSTIKSYNSQ